MIKTNSVHSKADLLWGRIATSVIFFVLGAAGGSWLARIPDVQKNLHLNSGVLGTVLLVGAVGGLVAMQVIPILLRRFGHRMVLGVLAPIYPFTMLGIPFANNAITLGFALALFSAIGSVVGVVVNTHAVDVEKAYERAIMSSFHAMYSIGGLIGAGIGGLLAAKGMSVLASLFSTSLILAVIVWVIISRLLRVAHASPQKFDASIDHLAHHHHKRAWWRGVVLIGALTFVCYMAEGAVADWSALFMREQRHANPALAVAAFVAFSACMTIGRLVGDPVTQKFGKITTIRFGAFLAACGLAIGIYSPTAIVAITGFAIVGCGLAVLVPVLFSIAGGLAGGESHAAIARVSTIAYFGLLVGPAAIGFIAHNVGLTYALLVPAILLVLVSSAAQLIRRVTKASVVV